MNKDQIDAPNLDSKPRIEDWSNLTAAEVRIRLDQARLDQRVQASLAFIKAALTA